jgi:hypothetical protein
VTKYNYSLLFTLLFFFYINFFLRLTVANWWIISDRSVCFKRSSSMFNIETVDVQSYKKNYNHIFSVSCWSSKIYRPEAIAPPQVKRGSASNHYRRRSLVTTLCVHVGIKFYIILYAIRAHRTFIIITYCHRRRGFLRRSRLLTDGTAVRVGTYRGSVLCPYLRIIIQQ